MSACSLWLEGHHLNQTNSRCVLQFNSLSLSKSLRFATHRLTEAQTSERQVRHFVFGIDANYFEHAWVTLTTVLRNQPKGQCHFHFLTADDLKGKFSRLEGVMASLDCAVSLHEVELKALEQLPASHDFPASIYLRLLAPYVLHREDQALYLDADVVCLKPLSTLWSTFDGKDALLAAVEDKPLAVAERVQALNLQAGRYFNSGVLLIPLARWRKERVTEKVLACIGTHHQRLKYGPGRAQHCTGGRCSLPGAGFQYSMPAWCQPGASARRHGAAALHRRGQTLASLERSAPGLPLPYRPGPAALG